MTEHPSSSPVTPPKKKRRYFRWLLIILLIGTSYLSYVLWHRAGQLQQQAYQQINPLIAQVTTLEQRIRTFQDQWEKSQQVVDNQIKMLGQQQQHLQDNVAILTHKVQQPQDNTEWIMAEITYLLNIAQQRLLLMKDVEGTLTAATLAQQRLNTLQHPVLYELKNQLAKEVEALQQLKRPPLKSSAKQLSDYMAQVEHLPLAQGQRSATSTAKGETTVENARSVSTTVWSQFNQLITLRYRPKADAEFLTEEQRFLVIQALRLKLEIARVYLLSQDFASFMTALTEVQAWLDRYYDQNDEMVKKLIADLTAMRVETTPLPDLTLSLKALQNITAAALLPPSDENPSP